MSSTPKAVRRNGGACLCPGDWRGSDDDVVSCRYGHCRVWHCPRCGGTWMDAGPVACPHKKREHPRWLRYPGMEQKVTWNADLTEFHSVRAAVKPSIAKRRNNRSVSVISGSF